MQLALGLAITTSSRIAIAGDSGWLLCKGIATHGTGNDTEKAPVVASLLEYRAADGDSRAR